MHPEILKFWNSSGKQIICLEEPIPGLTNVPLYFFFDSNGYREIIAAPWQGELNYRIDDHWLSEVDALRMINLKAFM